MASNKLSVCIITKNEAHNIQACLATVAWADEIIIVDSESTDATVAICQKFTNNIIITPYKGCGPQKKHACDLANNDWVLILDADERLTPELQQEIQAVLQNPKFDAYSMPFQTYYCGTAIRFGDWLNETHIRLIRKSKNAIVPRVVHFRIDTFGTIGKLKHKVLHYSFPNLEKVIDKMNSYSSYGAAHLAANAKHASIITALLHGIFAFMRGYIFKFGFLDGAAGLMLAISNAEGSYYKYLKLSLLKN